MVGRLAVLGTRPMATAMARSGATLQTRPDVRRRPSRDARASEHATAFAPRFGEPRRSPACLSERAEAGGRAPAADGGSGLGVAGDADGWGGKLGVGKTGGPGTGRPGCGFA